MPLEGSNVMQPVTNSYHMICSNQLMRHTNISESETRYTIRHYFMLPSVPLTLFLEILVIAGILQICNAKFGLNGNYLYSHPSIMNSQSCGQELLLLIKTANGYDFKPVFLSKDLLKIFSDTKNPAEIQLFDDGANLSLAFEDIIREASSELTSSLALSHNYPGKYKLLPWLHLQRRQLII